MNPLVALTTTIDPQGGDYRQPRVAVYANYIAALERVGLTPVLVTPGHGEGSVRRLVRECRGLVLSGGDDIDPARYGQDPIPELGPVNPPRDAMECRALDEASRLDLPILGICRGHQMLNVFFGGTLIQDLGTERDGPISHAQGGVWGSRQHFASVAPGTHLARAVGRDRLEINSYHHQAIDRLASNLVVTARAEDGLIEAVESRDHRWVVGIQWHPERHEARAEDSDPNIRIFAAFAEAVRTS